MLGCMLNTTESMSQYQSGVWQQYSTDRITGRGAKQHRSLQQHQQQQRYIIIQSANKTTEPRKTRCSSSVFREAGPRGPRTTTNRSCHIWLHFLPKQKKSFHTCNPDDGPLRRVQHVSRGRLGALHAVVFGQVPWQCVPRGGGDGDWTQVAGALLRRSPDQRPPPGSGLRLLHRLGGYRDENQFKNHVWDPSGPLLLIKFGVKRLFGPVRTK